MLLIAQRVLDVASAQKREGINTYRYSHGDAEWDGPPGSNYREENPGELVKKNLAPGFPRGGNRVRSFLDVLAPDTAAPEEIATAFQNFLLTLTHTWDFPVEAPFDRCFFTFYADPGLVPVQEAKTLFTHLHSLVTDP